MYRGVGENSETLIILGIGCVELRETLKDWEEDRRIMQNAQGRRQEEINRNLPIVWGETGNEEKESAIAGKGDSNLEDRNLAHHRSETSNGQEGETQNDISEE